MRRNADVRSPLRVTRGTEGELSAGGAGAPTASIFVELPYCRGTELVSFVVFSGWHGQHGEAFACSGVSRALLGGIPLSSM